LESRDNAIHGLEVISIMMNLFDQGEVVDIYVEDRINEAARSMASDMLKDGFSIDDTAKYTKLSVEDVEDVMAELKNLKMALN
jgi:ribosomal protein L21E